MSTILNKRWSDHKSCIKRKTKFYQSARIIGIEHFYIILIKYFSCNNKEELFREERLEYDKINNKNILSSVVPIKLYKLNIMKKIKKK